MSARTGWLRRAGGSGPVRPRIAAATSAKAILARDPADIGTVFVRAVLSR